MTESSSSSSSSTSTTTYSWSIEAFCQAQTPADLSVLPVSTQRFVDSLLPQHISTIHPFCQLYNDTTYPIQGIPAQGPLYNQDHLETWQDVLITALAMAVPELYAMTELWLRLFASLLAPICFLCLLQDEFDYSSSSNNSSSNNSTKNMTFSMTGAAAAAAAAAGGAGQKMTKRSKKSYNNNNKLWVKLSCFFSVASSMILLTDTFYVMEYGPTYGASFLAFSTLLAWRACQRYHWTRLLFVMAALLSLTIFLSVHTSMDGEEAGEAATPQFTFGFGDPIQQATNVPEGLYYDESNPFIANLVEHYWPAHQNYRHYRDVATPWMPTGDSRTGLPFLLNHVPEPPNKLRLWMPVQDGEEVVALDMFFPPVITTTTTSTTKTTTAGQHDPTKPVYLVLHGLNGGSQEDFGEDFIWRRTHQEGSTVVVMVARGLMDLPVRGWNVFHGARWTDVAEAAAALRQALAPNQILAGVGYSMGAIVLANYVTRSGKDCALDAAVSISGGLDMRFEIDFYRAQRLWQPLLTSELRNTFVIGKWGERVRARLTKEQLKSLMRATHVSEIDKTAVVAYNGFDDLKHYYSEMSALGDVPMEEYNSGTLSPNRRIHNISIPFCVLHALDDPLVTWRTVAANHGPMHPTNLTKTGSGNLLVLLTKQGGHVGWPIGWLPFLGKWAYMNDVAMSFVQAVNAARQSDTD